MTSSPVDPSETPPVDPADPAYDPDPEAPLEDTVLDPDADLVIPDDDGGPSEP